MYSNLLGLLVAIIIIILTEKYFEEFNNMNTNSTDKSYNKKFLKKHCKNINGKNVLVDLCGNELQINNIKSVYKNIKFKNGACNPCNPTCNFEITHANEQLSMDEKLKPKNSNKFSKKGGNGNIIVPTFKEAGGAPGPAGDYDVLSVKYNKLHNQTLADASGD